MPEVAAVRIGAQHPSPWMPARRPRLVEGRGGRLGVGVLAVRRDDDHGVVVGPFGARDLETGVIEGNGRLADDGPNVAAHLRRADGGGGTIVNGPFDPARGEAPVVEEFVGVHEQLGGNRSYPCGVVPGEWHIRGQRVVAAEVMHPLEIHRLDDLGQRNDLRPKAASSVPDEVGG
jgi:hypothetical protein